MDKNEFITEVLNLYSKGFYIGVSEIEGKNAKQSWIKACHTVLPENVNYKALWFQFLKCFDCKTISAIPSPQWLYRESLNFLKSGSFETEKRLEARRNLKSDPIPDEVREMRKKLEARAEERRRFLQGG